MNIDNFKKRYMPSKDFIKTVKQELAPKNFRRMTKNNIIDIAIHRRWQKYPKDELPMIYKDIATTIIDDINKFCTVTNIETGNGYFIFDFGANSVVHFKIKELKGWLFGMWFSYDEVHENTIKCEWFTQYELWLDKFKPCRSQIHCDTYWKIDDYIAETILQTDGDKNWNGNEIYENIKFMLKYPYLSLYKDFCCADLNLCYISNRAAKRKMKKTIKTEKSYNKNKERLEQKFKNKIIKELKKKFNNIKSIDANDRNIDGTIWSPRFTLEITVSNCKHLHDEIGDFIVDMQDNLAKKKKYNKYSIYNVVDDDVLIYALRED